MNIRFLCHPLRILVVLLSSVGAVSAQSTAFTYQGRLHEGGTPAVGLYDLRCALHDAVSGGAPLIRPVTNSAVAVSNGLFTIALDFGSKLFNGQDRWLEISVRTNGGGAFTTLAPRQTVTPSPSALYALSAGVADAVDTSAITTASLSNNAVTSAKILDGTITANDLSPAVAASTFWRLDGNAGTTAGTHFLGTSDDKPLELKVAGTRALRIEPNTNHAPNLIGGSAANVVAPGIEGATIAGGGTLSSFGSGNAFSNQIFASYGFIGGGFGNSIEGFSRFGVIGGGFSNQMTSQNFGSVIGGGLRNRLLQTTAGSVEPANVIAGGRDNFMDGICNNSVIGGGEDNQMIAQCGDAVIGGGDGNRMRSAHGSVIAGGETNEIWHAQGATLGGGRGNSVITNSVFSAIAGGVRNIARMNSPFSSIGGGSNNVAGAAFATIPGGQRNEAAGDFSFAAGRRARALHDGTFVWADQGTVSSGTEFSSSSSNQFLIRAARGVGIGTNNPQTALHVVGTVTATAFNPPSDRNLKENFTDVNPRDVLQRVARIAITRWNFKGDTATPHFGPMAQDFHAAFGLGADDKHIATVDADGVALAAIQGLNQKLEAENEAMRLELRARDTRLAELERRLTALERRDSRLSPGTESNLIP